VDVAIFDRFIYDELANLSLHSKIARAYVRMLLMFIPQPDICFLLDADPVQARARKPEYPLDFLYSSRESYLSLGEFVVGMATIAARPALDVEKEVLHKVFNRLSKDYQRLPFELKGTPETGE
jgi:thymidylate kinase